MERLHMTGGNPVDFAWPCIILAKAFSSGFVFPSCILCASGELFPLVLSGLGLSSVAMFVLK
jgi:hypothetical protein